MAASARQAAANLRGAQRINPSNMVSSLVAFFVELWQKMLARGAAQWQSFAVNCCGNACI